MTDKKERPSEVFQVALTTEDMEAIIEIMNFANTAAAMLAHQEITKGSGYAAAAKYNRMARDAQEFSALMVKHLDVGEPEDGQIH